ncbi:hypothetical protein BJ165DRAFT_1448474 [Panaeolus papilionaceus]|nr:hypothetical protein BJ165DRAFT_1448474 [Panaeolus papilionaceus]
MLVVADLDEVFAPARDVFYVNPHERRNAIEALLDSIPSRFAEHISTDSCLGSAVRGALATLEGQTGHILIFQSTLPTLGAGALPPTPPPEIDFYVELSPKTAVECAIMRRSYNKHTTGILTSLVRCCWHLR